MTLDQLKKAVQDFFANTNISITETREGLEEIAEMCESFAESLGEEGE